MHLPLRETFGYFGAFHDTSRYYGPFHFIPRHFPVYSTEFRDTPCTPRVSRALSTFHFFSGTPVQSTEFRGTSWHSLHPATLLGTPCITMHSMPFLDASGYFGARRCAHRSDSEHSMQSAALPGTLKYFRALREAVGAMSTVSNRRCYVSPLNHCFS